MSGPVGSPVVVREAVPDDAEALARCHLACWQEAYAGLVEPDLLARLVGEVDERVERWRQILHDFPGRLLAEDDGAVVGLGSAGPTRDADPGLPPLELYALYVRQAYWDTGLGHRLLVATLGDADATLWVFRDNERARRFYARHGFVPTGTEQDEPTFHRPEVRLVRGPS